MPKPDRYFILKGSAGLGNRLITLTSVISYCLKTGRRLLVDWSDGMFGPEGKNRFSDYFVLKDIDHVVSISDVGSLGNLSVYPRIFRNHMTDAFWEVYDEARLLGVWKRRYVRLVSLNRWRVTSVWPLKKQFHGEIEEPHRFAVLRNFENGRTLPVASEYPQDLEEDVLVGSDYFPPFDSEFFRRHVEISPPMIDRLEKIRKELGIGKETLGIHVRQTDWKWFKSMDPLLRRLRSCVASSKAPIFLATDSVAALDEIRKIVPSVIIFPKHLPEPKEGGLHHFGYRKGDPELAAKMFDESVIDLYLLSRCGTLWFQGGSSFSTVARALTDPQQSAEDWTQF